MEERLHGGNAGGAVLVDGTVRRRTGAWTPAIHALLTHLDERGFTRAPRPLGVDEAHREILTYLPGATVGDTKPWPGWVRDDDTLLQVAEWLSDFHRTVADFIPPEGAVWRMGGTWEPGLIICHNDAAPYNAAWQDNRLAGFFDWDFAGPAAPEWDLAFTACAWVPLHAQKVAAAEGFTAFGDRRRRLSLFLAGYGWQGATDDLLRVVDARLEAHCEGILRLAREGDELFARLIDEGVVDDIQMAREELGTL